MEELYIVYSVFALTIVTTMFLLARWIYIGYMLMSSHWTITIARMEHLFIGAVYIMFIVALVEWTFSHPMNLQLDFMSNEYIKYLTATLVSQGLIWAFVFLNALSMFLFHHIGIKKGKVRE